MHTIVSEKSKHLDALDGMRGVAAIAVVLHHACQIAGWGSNFAYAHLAVDFFFILSGLVIAMAYEEKLRKSALSFPRFALIRLARLYPMIVMGTVLGSGVLLIRLMTTHTLTGSELAIAAFSAFALLPTRALFSLYPTLYPVNTAEWSLFFELAINGLYAPLARWLSNLKLAILCVVSGIALYGVARINNGIDVGFTEQNFLYGFIRVVFSFTVGVLLFRYRPRWRMSGWCGVPLALLLTAVLFAPPLAHSALWEFIAVAVIFPLIGFAGSVCAGNTRLTPGWLFLGELSYPMYLTHQPTLRIISNAVNILKLNISAGWLLLLSVAGAVLVAFLFLMVWDRPVRGWLRRFITR